MEGEALQRRRHDNSDRGAVCILSYLVSASLLLATILNPFFSYLYLIRRFTTYFPHVDNIYSHRSTQHYKRKPFIAHYWDCRLRGRAPGTPKSNDPNKKKRKRTARQRDLCDVKIKITEHCGAPGSEADNAGAGDGFPSELLGSGASAPFNAAERPFDLLVPDAAAAGGGRYFTVQRVNGNGANGKSDAVGCGGHRHSLEESDRVKKNSVQRFLLKEAQETKKAGVRMVFLRRS